jgi:hypothetical protein
MLPTYLARAYELYHPKPTFIPVGGQCSLFSTFTSLVEVPHLLNYTPETCQKQIKPNTRLT